VFDDEAEQTSHAPSPRFSLPAWLRPALAPAVCVAVLVLAAIAGQLATGQVTVRPGDTLSGIAREQGSSVKAIAAANNIADPNIIRAGQVLTIPPAAGEIHYTLQPGDTLTAVAKRFGSSVAAISARNGITDVDRVVAGRDIVVPITPLAPPTTAPAPTVPVPPPPTTAAPASSPPTTAAPATTAPMPTTAPPTTAAPTTAPRTGVVSTLWVVQPGDTVASIAARLGIDPRRLAAANAITVSTPLTPGQRLIVP
jgi:LysM repeat protein